MLTSRGDSHGPKGFTLVELMVALVIGAGLLLSGRLLLEQVVGTEHAIATETAEQDTVAHRWRLLRLLVRNLEVGSDNLATFGGTEHTMHFTSWCSDSVIQRVRCTVQLRIDTVLTASTSIAPTLVLQRTGEGGQFRYLADAHNGGHWYTTWANSVTIPPAIGVVAGHDTTVLRIGAGE